MKARAAKKDGELLLTTEGAARLWEEIVRGLRQAGYDQVGPEYLKLSRVLTQARTSELLQGQTSDEAAWRKIRQAAAEAWDLLEPLVESARLLARLPTGIEAAGAQPAGGGSESGGAAAVKDKIRAVGSPRKRSAKRAGNASRKKKKKQKTGKPAPSAKRKA